MENKALCGIYKIENKVNKKVYIGQSKNIKQRWVLEKGGACNVHLRESLIKYGLNKFLFSILEECPQAELTEKEIHYIKQYESWNPDKGYNKTFGGKCGVSSVKKETKMEIVKFSLDEEDVKALKDYVEESGATVSSYVRKVVKAELSRRGVITLKKRQDAIQSGLQE